MDITFQDRTQADNIGLLVDEMPRRPAWPAFVIAFAISATMLWSGVLLWLLSRMISTRFAGLDPASHLLSLSPWTAGAVAALIVMLCLLAFNRAGSQGVIGALARIALVMVGAGVSWVALASHSDVAAERRVLDARAHELLTRASSMPGSALACLDAMAGDTVESACERALFQTPEATAAAVSYTSAQLTLLADLTMHVRRSNAPDEPAALGNLRRAIERDRFGLVAHVLTIRDGCTPHACVAFVLLDDTSRIRNNLAERTYDVYVVRHSALWSDTDKLPVATVAPRAAPAAPATAGMGAGLFPSAESIPPVNIIDPESRAPAKFGSTPASSATRQVPMPRPRPVRMGSPAQPGTSRQPGHPLSRMDWAEQERGSKVVLPPP
jgi:hypothetical protein